MVATKVPSPLRCRTIHLVVGERGGVRGHGKITSALTLTLSPTTDETDRCRGGEGTPLLDSMSKPMGLSPGAAG